MTPSRNAPCPCGSGRKYKRCCAAADRAASARASRNAPLDDKMIAAVKAADVWEADLIGVPGVPDWAKRGRYLVLLVVSTDIVLDCIPVEVISSDPERLATLLAEGLERSAQSVGAWPSRIRFRHMEFAEILQDTLPEGTLAEADFFLDDLDAVARPLIDVLVEDAPWPPMGQVPTWAAWGLAPNEISAFFTAYARLHRAAPWRWIDEVIPVWIEWDDGREWVLSVVGAAGFGYGLLIHSDDRSLFGLVDEESSANGFAVAELTERYGDQLRSPDERIIAGDRFILRYPPVDPSESDPGVPALLADLRAQIQAQSFESEEDMQTWLDGQMEEYNRTHLPELSGLSPDQARLLLNGNWDDTGPLRIAQDLTLDDLSGARFVHNARVLLQALIESKGTPATPAGNFRRAFVNAMLEQMQWPEGRLEAIRSRARVLNEQDVMDLHIARVVLELADLIEFKKSRFQATRRGHAMVVDDAAGDLAALLFRTFFRRLNLSYLDQDHEQPELQELAALLLWKVGTMGTNWARRDAFTKEILPGSLKGGALDDPSYACHRRIVLPLVDFGVLEERDIDPMGRTDPVVRIRLNITCFSDG